MHINSLLLGLAAPAAHQAVESAADVVEGVKDAFASILNGMGNAPDTASKAGNEGDAANADSSTSVGEIVEEFQRWLRDLGLGGGPSEVRVDLDAAGEARFDVAGLNAEQIRHALNQAENSSEPATGNNDGPAWTTRLRQLTVALQHEASQIRGGSVPAVSLSIREANYQVSVAG